MHTEVQESPGNSIALTKGKEETGHLVSPAGAKRPSLSLETVGFHSIAIFVLSQH